MNKRSRKSAKRAFTLLEVLMVVVIIGLLAAFIVPNLFSTQQKSEVKLTKAKIDSGLSGALDRFRLDMGRYPTSDEGLMVLITAPDEDVEEGSSRKWAGPYLKKAADIKDVWGSELIYESPGQYNEGGYDLSSAGPDRQPGTDDDIANWTRT